MELILEKWSEEGYSFSYREAKVDEDGVATDCRCIVGETMGKITAYCGDMVIFNGYLFDGGNMMVGILNVKKIKAEGNAD